MSETEAGKRRNPVGRAFRIISHMIDGGEPSYGVREIASELGYPPSAVFRQLAALEEAGIVDHLEGGRYSLGLEFHRIAWRAATSGSIREIAQPVLNRLTKVTGETAVLGLYDPARRRLMFAAKSETDYPLRYMHAMNEWLPVHAGATGLGIIAFLDREERREVMEQEGVQPLTERTIIDHEELEEEVLRIQQRGYAISRGQRTRGAVGIAAPVWGRSRKVIGDIIVSIPEHRFDPSRETQLGEQVRDAADEVTQLTGGIDPREF